MRIEDVVGQRMRDGREALGISQEALGVLLGEYLAKPWPRQAVSAAEKGQRAFAAVELVALSVVIGCDVAELLRLPADTEALTMPSEARLTREQLNRQPGQDAPTTIDVWQSMRELVNAAESIRTAGCALERNAKQLYGELDAVLS